MKRSSLEFSSARLLLALAVCAAAAAPAAAGNAEDDLQAVKKAVLASSDSRVRPPAEDPGGAAEMKPQARGKGGPLWLRVRVVEKAHKRARVSISLPIGLVRGFGDDWPIASSDGCRKRDRCGATLGAILRALDSGESLVDIEDDAATVRVWVE